MHKPTHGHLETADDLLGAGRLSLAGKRWLLKRADDRLALTLAQRLGIPEVLGRVMAGRGIGLDDAESFLDPKLKSLLPDPLHLNDMDKAASRLAQAVEAGETVWIFGDYDVDGATSSAVLKRFLQAAGARVEVYIPDRLEEGYGPNAPALQKLKDQGASLVVTVDCGQTAFEPLAAAKALGLDVIVFDHHEGEARLPDAFAVVNPNRLDDQSPHGQIAAVGVAFLAAVAVNARLRESGWYQGRTEPDLMALLDIVALGTVADVVALTGVNRALVAQGLKVMARRQNVGLRALADVAGIKEPPSAYHLGFVLGPRINAGGRVGQSDLGARLLATPDPAEALALAERLDALNAERQAIEAAVLDEAISKVETELQGGPPGPFVLAAGEGWHPGVIGIVASRIKERYNRPAAVVTWLGDEGTGSARSVTGADLGAAVIAARQSGLLLKGGGHAMAAGFSLARTQLKAFEDFMDGRMTAELGNNPPPPGLMIDGILGAEGATLHLVEILDRLAPFGVGNPEPRFCIKGARVAKADPVGADGAHLSLILTGQGGRGRLKGIAFRAFDTPLGAALMGHDGRAFDVVGRLKLNVWNGFHTVQIQVDDAVGA